MDRRIEEDVEGWPTRPIDGGYDGLRQLAAADFSGAVRARGATMFMLNGRIVGVFDGTVEDFEDASGTAHKAPHQGLPLLYTMQAMGGETRGKYYTEDTPISEVDGTLSEGNFTGYLELSENVLSGDYYLVYHAGRSMSLAFIGNSGRLVTGEDAYERADDEVGIYEVVDVEVNVRDVPGVGEDDAGAAEDEPAGADDAAEEAAETAPEDAAGGDAGATQQQESAGEQGAAPDDGAAGSGAAAGGDGAATGNGGAGAGNGGASAGNGGATAGNDGAAVGNSGAPAENGGAPAGNGGAGAGTGEPSGAEAPASDAGGAAPAESPGGAADPAASRGEAGQPPAGDAQRGRESPPGGAGTAGAGAGAGGAGNAQRDPAGDAGAGQPGAGAEAAQSRTSAGNAGGADAGSTEGVAQPASNPATVAEATTIPSVDPDRTGDLEQLAQHPETMAGGGRARGSQEVDDALEREVLEREDRIDRLEQRASNLRAERDRIAAERDELAQRVQELEAENDQLESRLQRLEQQVDGAGGAPAEAGGDGAGGAPADAGGAQAGGAGGTAASLRPREALQGTDLFVRYDSKGAATLEDVPEGAERTEVNDNLRLDLHTRFDADEATVDGEPFREFLEHTMSHRFVDWLVRTLPYEIRETGQEAAMRDCYDAIPEIDRVEFDGVVELTYEEDGEPVEAEESFDVVVRDRMGDPLFVADMNDSRDPAEADMLLDLQSGATRVKESEEDLAGAFAVTRSFFDPEALETAAEATGGSLLSRDSRKSYVRVGRKQGYHLCLVEDREGNLHLNVPEL